MGAHHHQHAVSKRLVFAIFLNVFIVVALFFGGWISGSLALVSDALHNLSDVASLVISLFAMLLANRRVSPARTFGYKRAEIIAALVNAIILLGVVVFLVKESVHRFSQPLNVDGGWVIVLALLSIVVNGVCVLLLKHDADESLNIRSAYWHLFADMITSIAVLVGGVAILFWQVFWVDSVISLVIAVYLFYVSWQLLHEALKVLMLFSPSHLSLEQIQEAIVGLDAIDNIHHVHFWQLSDKDVHFEAHVDFHEDLPLSEVSQVMEQVRQLLVDKFAIYHCVLQPEIHMSDSKELLAEDCLVSS